MRATFAALARNLVAGARLAFFRRTSPLAFRFGAAELLALFALSCLLDVGIDWLRYGPDAQLSLGAVGAELAGLALPFVVGMLLAAATGERDLALALPLVVLAALVPAQLAFAAIAWARGTFEGYEGYAQLASDVALLWVAVTLLRACLVLLQGRSARPWLALGATVALCAPLLLPEGILPNAPWWVGDDASTGASLASEPVLAIQRQLQDDALGALEERAPDRTNLYFVAFAGDGDAATWGERAELARQMMDGHWATEGRSLVYVNDPSPDTDAIRATVSHLREALQEIAAVGDPAEDVVMLWLAGRSNRDGTLRITLPGVDLVQLSGAALRGLLDEAGFEHRVVVVTTCEPGAFIEALADARTAVLANVPPGESERQCRGGAEPTSVADRLWKEGFPRATTLRGALDSLRADAREPRGGDGAPWLHVGPGIADKLDEIRNAKAGGVTASRRATHAPG